MYIYIYIYIHVYIYIYIYTWNAVETRWAVGDPDPAVGWSVLKKFGWNTVGWKRGSLETWFQTLSVETCSKKYVAKLDLWQACLQDLEIWICSKSLSKRLLRKLGLSKPVVNFAPWRKNMRRFRCSPPWDRGGLNPSPTSEGSMLYGCLAHRHPPFSEIVSWLLPIWLVARWQHLRWVVEVLVAAYHFSTPGLLIKIVIKKLWIVHPPPRVLISVGAKKVPNVHPVL